MTDNSTNSSKEVASTNSEDSVSRCTKRTIGQVSRIFHAESVSDLRSAQSNPREGWAAITEKDGTYVAIDGAWIPHNQNNPIFETTTTDTSFANSVSGVFVESRSSQFTNCRGFTWADLKWVDFGTPIVSGSDNGSDRAAYASLLHGPTAFDNAIDEWYLIYGTHANWRGGGIFLQTASKLWTNEWDYQGKILDVSDVGDGHHIDAPCAVIDPYKDRLNVYYHQLTHDSYQQEELAVTPLTGDGTDLTKETVVMKPRMNGRWDESVADYMFVKRVGDVFIATYNGEWRNRPGPGGSAISYDGEQFVRERTPVFDQTYPRDLDNGDTYSSGGASSPLVINGEPYIATVEAETKQPQILPWEQRHRGLAQPSKLIMSHPDWASPSNPMQVRQTLVRGRYLYALYDLPGEYNIGLARTPLTEMGR